MIFDPAYSLLLYQHDNYQGIRKFYETDSSFVGASFDEQASSLKLVLDSDNDGVGDSVDNCPDIKNSEQSDFDSDQVGNLCDPNPGLYPGYYKITAKHSGRVLDVSEISKENGASIHQWDWWNGDNQKWFLQTVGGDYSRLSVKHSGKCMDVSGPSYDNGANIQQWSCHGGDNQKFRIVEAGEGYYKIIAKHSGKCMDVSRYSYDDGANIHQWTCHGGDNQKFRIDRLD